MPHSTKAKVGLLARVLMAALFLAVLVGANTCGDMDWDDVTDEEDNCPEEYNPAQADGDGDGIGDPCDMETPHYGNWLGKCYRSNWGTFSGGLWDDIETTLTPHEAPGAISVKLSWPETLGDLIERGPGRQNGRDIWFMVSNTGGDSYFSTFVEGTATEIDDAGIITRFEGVFVFLECLECWPDDPAYAYWEWVGTSEWTAELMPLGFCGLEDDEPFFDDDAPDDDDTADDDDDTADDDDDNDDDDDDDDAAGDDEAAGDDDDDDEGACGC